MPLADSTINSHDRLANSDDAARLRAILETAVEAIIQIDEQGIVESINSSGEQMFGYRSDEIVGQNISILMPSPFREEHDRYIKNYLTTGERKIIGNGREAIGLRRDGSIFPIQLSVSEVKLRDRRVFAGFVADITEKKRVEESLRREHSFVESILATVRAIVLVLDTEGKIIRFNPYVEKLSGYSLQELRGKDWFETFIPPPDHDRIRELFRQCLAGHSGHGFINRVMTKDGREREIAWWDTHLRDASGQTIGLICTGHDVTELNEANRRLVQSERLAAIGEAMASLAHESRNSLQRSQVCLEMLSDRLGGNPDDIELINVIQRSLDDVHRLYEEVRQFAAPIRIEPVPKNIRALVHDVWSQLAESRRNRKVQLVEQIACDELCCEIDPFWIGRVFRNMFENSLAACDDPAEITIEYRDDSSQGIPALRLAVRDNGPGMNSEQMSRVFDSFYTTKTKGTGLGMAIARRVMEAHHGTIGVNPDYVGGAEFILTLPRRQTTA
jgi:PAS domain S-box-containing protein